MGEFTLYMDVWVSILCSRYHQILPLNQENMRRLYLDLHKNLIKSYQKRYLGQSQTKCGKSNWRGTDTTQ